MAITFDDVGSAALAEALILLPQWLSGGTRRGHEYLGERKANGGPGDSWTVNLNTGAWMHGAGSEKGGDLISLYAALNHINNGAALKQVAQLIGVTDGPTPRTLPRTMPAKPKEKPSEPIPDNPPQPPPHPTLGVATATYRYGRAFWITRYDPPTGKEFCWHTWRNGKWYRQGYSGLRPAYNADLLGARPDAPVLIVEGEKCADIASQQLRKYVCMTWAGGSNAVKQTDWTCLASRDVIIWPDADDTGRAAGAQLAEILAPIATRVRIVQPNGQDPGWDIDDAVKEGMGPHEIAKWCAAHITDKISKPASEPAPTTAAAVPDTTEPSQEDSSAATAEPGTLVSEYLAAEDHDEDFENGAPRRSFLMEWQSLGLAANSNKIPHPTLSNASSIIQKHEEFRNKIWLDEFRGRVYHSMFGRPEELVDADVRRITAFIQQSLGLYKFSLAMVHEGVQHAAEANARNPLLEWLNSLEWDGEERLETWLLDCLGASLTPYTMAVAKNWAISMVARAYDPGCKADHMPILEGGMGAGKSSFLEILGGEWYESVTTEIGSLEFLQDIQGIWLVEIPDMSGFGRREHGQILAAITVKRDRYRQSYGRLSQGHKRTCIFAATSEKDDYLKDLRGHRRFWPIRCGEISLDVLRAQRDQIFAQAVKEYKAGTIWHKMPAEAIQEQLDRGDDDLWSKGVLMYARDAIDRAGTGKVILFPSDVLHDVLKIDPKDQGQSEKNRVANILQRDGWVQTKHRGDRCWTKPRSVD